MYKFTTFFVLVFSIGEMTARAATRQKQFQTLSHYLDISLWLVFSKMSASVRCPLCLAMFSFISHSHIAIHNHQSLADQVFNSFSSKSFLTFKIL